MRSLGGIASGGSCVDGGVSTSSDTSACESALDTSSSELERVAMGRLDTDLRLFGGGLEDALGLAVGRGGLNVFRSVGRPGAMILKDLWNNDHTNGWERSGSLNIPRV